MVQNRRLLAQRSIDLARSRFQKVSIHPQIGWVVAQQQIVAEGWLNPDLPYQNQLADCLKEITFPVNSTLFVSTNPFENSAELHAFADQSGIKEVQIAREFDDFLRSAEWSVNRRVYTFYQKKRPYIVLKWAQTADGLVARSNYDSKWISGVHARKLVHRWRSQEAAIWVGKNTYRYDNPQLNVRDWSGENPLRIVVDPDQTLDKQLNVFDQSQPTLCYTHRPPLSVSNLEFTSLPDTANWPQRIAYVLTDLYRRQAVSVFIEGGSQFLSFLIQQGWWDEARVFSSKTTFGEGITAPTVEEKYLVAEERVSEDQLTTYFRS
ncbi:RibD family protein [Tunicatimonas pelagia]|uniref:RibD family protein n=1 Tax=Tunicatimonas pelagia TaxID=931531 RepID=UPI0026661A4B|nr:RibD family protein [Tunicatimonas pelagia]WKN46108.1 RibD family protein [Tunicatimonas pelagia]